MGYQGVDAGGTDVANELVKESIDCPFINC